MVRHKDTHIEYEFADNQGQMKVEVNDVTGQRRNIGYTPYVPSKADDLTLQVLEAAASRAGAYASVAAAALDLAVTQGSQVVANLASNPDLAHIAQRLSDAQPGALGVLVAAAGVGIEEAVRHTRKSREIAQGLRE